MKEQKEGYIVHDKRFEEEPKEVCRVCGSQEVHTREYNNPTMKCIEYLRLKIVESAQAKA